MSELKRQRVRDPLHNLIEFDEGDPFERMLWRVIRTAPFQRLRRIRQLGFSDLVYPGATHSRFIHSLGVFHTARQLMEIVRRYVPNQPGENIKAEAALAAALVHDVGHGPFSHAFEAIGERRRWRLVGEHENHSEALIRSTDKGTIGAILNGFSEGFADMVADVVRGGPATVYRSIVSSQFDADRLDYVRRDRLMTGTQLASIDFEWLRANLEIGELPRAEDGIRRETFVLGPKAIYAAEAFVSGLFQMYPTVYFHKATRGAEKLMQALLERVVELVEEGNIDATGLPIQHPLVKLVKQPNDLNVLAELDDTVVFGALPMLALSRDELVSALSRRLRDRNLFKAIDLHPLIVEDDLSVRRNQEHEYLRRQSRILEEIEQWTTADPARRGRILVDTASRKPYKPIEDEGPMNQIWIREGSRFFNLEDRSPSVRAIDTYRAFRAYVADEDIDARRFVLGLVSEIIKEPRA